MKGRNQSVFLPFLRFLYSYVPWTVTAFWIYDQLGASVPEVSLSAFSFLTTSHSPGACVPQYGEHLVSSLFGYVRFALLLVTAVHQGPSRQTRKRLKTTPRALKIWVSPLDLYERRQEKEITRAFFWRWPGLHPCLRTADPRLTSQVNIILLCMASPAYEHAGMPRSGDSRQPMNV